MEAERPLISRAMDPRATISPPFYLYRPALYGQTYVTGVRYTGVLSYCSEVGVRAFAAIYLFVWQSTPCVCFLALTAIRNRETE